MVSRKSAGSMPHELRSFPTLLGEGVPARGHRRPYLHNSTNAKVARTARAPTSQLRRCRASALIENSDSASVRWCRVPSGSCIPSHEGRTITGRQLSQDRWYKWRVWGNGPDGQMGGVVKQTLILPGTIVLMLGMAACTNPYDPGQRAIGGGLIGAGTGAAIGGAAGGGAGGAIGAVAGGAVGAIAGAASTPSIPPPAPPPAPPPIGTPEPPPPPQPPGFYEEQAEAARHVLRYHRPIRHRVRHHRVIKQEESAQPAITTPSPESAPAAPPGPR